MKRTAVRALAATLFSVVGCCKSDPALVPPLDQIQEWSHLAGIGTGTGCVTDIEAEPNDSVVEANLPRKAGLAACTPFTLEGSVAGDVDAFYFWGDPCSKSIPTATLTAAAEGLRLCLFVACAVGRTGMDPNTPCASGSEVYRLDEGMLGCCATHGPVGVNATCESQRTSFGSHPEFDAFVVVDRPDGGADAAGKCESYSVTVSL